MFRKIASLAMAVMMLFTVMTVFASCSGDGAGGIKIGCIMVGDETEGYTLAHMEGIKEAAKELGISESQIIWKYKIEENSDCYDAAVELVGRGCQLIIATHSPFLLSIDGARIYDLDSDPVQTRQWWELENTRIYFDFFYRNKELFLKG